MDKLFNIITDGHVCFQLVISPRLQLRVQPFDAGPDTKSERVTDKALALQVVGNLGGCFTVLNFNRYGSTYSGRADRLKNIGDDGPGIIDTGEDKYTKQKDGYNGST